MRDWDVKNIFKAEKVSNVLYILFLAKPDMYSGALKKRITVFLSVQSVTLILVVI